VYLKLTRIIVRKSKIKIKIKIKIVIKVLLSA